MKSAAIIASYPYYHYDRLGRIDCVFSQRGGAGAEHLIASYKYYPTGSVKTVTLGNSLSLTYTYHISGVVKSAKVVSANGGEYSYYGGTNKLKSVADNMGGSTSYRTMSANDNFAYDRDGNLVEDKSKQMKIAYNWRGMPIEFVRKTDSGDSLKLVMKYDGSGRRVSKTSMRKAGGEWDTLKATHYTGIGTEIREEFADSAAETKVVVPMPQGLGRYGIKSASDPGTGARTFEWYLKNHLGSTMLVYGTTGTASGPELKHAYDYRSFGEQIDLTKRNDKVTENFTGKEKDDETELNYFGARYLDPMLGMWTSVDPARQFSSPYLYAGNGVNPVNGVDPDGKDLKITLTNERYQVWMTSHVNKYKGGDNIKGQVSQTVPLYKMTIENESGSTAYMPVTRDAIAGKGPFNVDGVFMGSPRYDGGRGFRIELLDPVTKSPAIKDENGVVRTNIQIHIGPGCSEGCSLLQDFKAGRDFFEGIVKDFLLEDQKNGFSNDITVETPLLCRLMKNN